MYRQVTFLIFIFFLPLRLVGQEEDCTCEDDIELILCYTSVEDYCFGVHACEYALDGRYMEGLNEKLNNQANFSQFGINNCPVELRKLPPVSTVASIETAGCDVVFVCNFPVNDSLDIDIESTSIPPDVLDTIKRWSIICERNLAIVTQKEAESWGYIVEDENINPNVPVPNESNFSVFNSDFGQISSFEQGGGFQGVFTQTPATGSIVLAQDNLGQPTIVVDKLTNDIILGDIGIFCSKPAGPVSKTPDIINTNDILVCNVFALGCLIASNSSKSYEDVSLCEGETLVLFNGDTVTTPGNYIDSLTNIYNCDSIVEKTVYIGEHTYAEDLYDGCAYDGFEKTIGDILFNEENNIGTATIRNVAGCDSIINVMFDYSNERFRSVDKQICVTDSILVGDTFFKSNLDTLIFRPNAEGCDSVISIKLSSFDLPSFQQGIQIEVLNGIDVEMDNEASGFISYNWFPSEGLSCSDCLNPLVLGTTTVKEYRLEATDGFGCKFSYLFPIKFKCDPYISNIFNPSQSLAVNNVFQANSPCDLPELELRIFDRWGNQLFYGVGDQAIWDGNSNGVEVAPGVYTYLLNYMQEGNEERRVGTVTLVR